MECFQGVCLGCVFRQSVQGVYLGSVVRKCGSGLWGKGGGVMIEGLARNDRERSVGTIGKKRSVGAYAPTDRLP